MKIVYSSIDEEEAIEKGSLRMQSRQCIIRR